MDHKERKERKENENSNSGFVFFGFFCGKIGFYAVNSKLTLGGEVKS